MQQNYAQMNGTTNNGQGGQGNSNGPNNFGYNPYALPPSSYHSHGQPNSIQQHGSYSNGTNGALHSQTPNPREQQLQNQQMSSNAISPAWAKQLEEAAANRMAASPHHHARLAQLERRGYGSSALSIVDPKDKLFDPSGITSSTSSHATVNGLPPRQGSALSSAKSSSLFHKKTDSIASDRSKHTSKASTSPSQISDGKEIDDSSTVSSWTTLDMGGMALKNLSSTLFAYSFLTVLYLPHNALTSLPPALCQLTSLIRLDVSSNKLTSVPPEMGTLTSLRELLLFDNLIVTLPAELGTLHLLDILGIEGNPLQESLRTIAEKDGTAGLIAFLRDSCPVPAPPVEREWINIDQDDLPTAEDADDGKHDGFSVLCYNILCEKYATGQIYGYTPSWALSWEYRKELVLQEVLGYEADILCLQEVDIEQYEEYFQHNLSQHDYEGVHYPKSRARTMNGDERRHVDGCATFYKSTTFSLVEEQLIEFNQIAMRRPDFKKTEDMFNRVMTKDNIAVVLLLEHRVTGARLIVANAHIHWDHDFRDVKLVQVAMLLDELDHIAERFARLPPRFDLAVQAPSYKEGGGSKIPTIISGDFNSVPDSGVYEFLSKGKVEAKHEDFGEYIYGKYTTEGLTHQLNLKSSYNAIDELPFTNYTPNFKGVIDYIWHTSNTLNVTGLLGEVDPGYLSKVVGFPNAHYPSDHICILSEFKFKRSKTTTAVGNGQQ